MLRPRSFALAAAGLVGLGANCDAGKLGRIAFENSVVTSLPVRPAPHHPRAGRLHGARLAVAWLGHASALIQLDDKLILADPLLTFTAGYFSKRLVAPAVRPREVAPVDVVLVSHMHFDHLSLDTLFALRSRIGELVLPQDGARYVPDYGIPLTELATWQSWERDGLRITAVPAQHVGWRFGIDRIFEPRSFTGYILEYRGLVVYFAGDTGYQGEHFREIREHFPHLDLALIPIAPLEPHDLMAHNHVNADEALQAFLDVGADRMIPIHFDTFINSFDAPGDADVALEKARVARGLTTKQVMRFDIGEQRILLPVRVP